MDVLLKNIHRRGRFPAGGSAKQARRPPHPGDPPAARQAPQRRLRQPRISCAPTRSSPTSSLALGVETKARPPLQEALRYERVIIMTRRRRRRRPHRRALDHLLLPASMPGDHPRRAPLPRAAAALPPRPRRAAPNTPRDDAHKDELDGDRLQGARSRRSAGLQGPGRNDARPAEGATAPCDPETRLGWRVASACSQVPRRRWNGWWKS